MKDTKIDKKILDINDQHRKLLQLDKETLVKALIDLSYRHDDVANIIERLTSKKTSNVERFKERLSEFHGNNNFVSWNNAHKFAYELIDLLSDIESGANDPKEGIELLKLFFCSDEHVMNNCDDSSGNIGDVFRYQATELFETYASQCDDKDWLANILFELITNNDYGLRDNLIENIGEYLPEKNIRILVDQIKKEDGFGTSEGLLLQAMARGLKDPVLFESIINEESSKNEDYDASRIGEMWLECGNPEKAITYLEKVSRASHSYLGNIEELLLKAYSLTDNFDKQRSTTWTIFRNYRTSEKFERVIQIEGVGKRDELLKQEVSIIYQDKKINNQNVDFLLELKLLAEAENYIMEREHDLRGGFYGTLSDWADAFAKDKRFLVSTLIYRALLDSILERAYAKAYHHGADYLRMLDKYSERITNWGSFVKHEKYFEHIKLNHKRKISFWSQYKNG